MTFEPARNIALMLKNKRLGFPDLAEPRSINGGKPSFGARIIVTPDDPDVKQIDEAMEAVAKFQWKDNWENALKMLVSKNRVAFSKSDYCNKDGKVYAGFEGNYSLGASAPQDRQPLLLDEYGNQLAADMVQRKLYAGCVAHFKVEFYPLLRDDGNRVNCALLGVMFAKDGEAFGGGGSVASVNDFASMAAAPANADDLL